MKRPPQSISLQQHTSSKRIITDLEIRIGETTKRLERALSADKVHNVVVESKSKSLQVLFRTLLSCSALLSWMYFGFLRPMEHEAVQMHAQQFDPSQIAATPYSLQRLALYTGVTVLVALSQHGWSVCKDWLILTMYTLGAMLLSGASTNTNLIHSVLAASYWTTLAFLLEPPFLSRLALFSFASSHLLSDDHSTSLQPSSLSSSSTRCSFYSPWLSKAMSSVDLSSLVFHMTLAATIPLQILTLYDRGWQWQRWPVPMIVGSTCGWALGTMLAAWKQVFPAITVSSK